MEIKYKNYGRSLIVYFYGELDEYSASETKNIVDKLIEDNLNSDKVVFDLSGVTFMDSTGIGLLIGRYKKVRRFNIPIYIQGASVATEKVIEIAGIYKIMPKI